MTQTELESLRDVTPRMGHVERNIGGRRVLVPVAPEDPGAMLTLDDDGLFQCQATGKTFLVGRVNGERVRREV